jgi:CspA family cold shock protein
MNEQASDAEMADTTVTDSGDTEPMGGASVVEEGDFGEPREIGRVKWFDEQKGYGFIERVEGSDVFVHFSQVRRDPQTLREDEQVEFTPAPGEKGPEAHDVVVTLEKPAG